MAPYCSLSCAPLLHDLIHSFWCFQTYLQAEQQLYPLDQTFCSNIKIRIWGGESSKFVPKLEYLGTFDPIKILADFQIYWSVYLFTEREKGRDSKVPLPSLGFTLTKMHKGLQPHAHPPIHTSEQLGTAFTRLRYCASHSLGNPEVY